MAGGIIRQPLEPEREPLCKSYSSIQSSLTTSITTTVQGGMCGEARRAARRLAWERFARSLLSWRILQPPQQLIRPELFPGQHFPHHPVDLRPRDPGHLFPPKPVAGSAEKLRPADTGLRGDASPPRRWSRTRPAPTSLFSVSNSVSIRHREPPTYARVSNGVSTGALDR